MDRFVVAHEEAQNWDCILALIRENLKLTLWRIRNEISDPKPPVCHRSNDDRRRFRVIIADDVFISSRRSRCPGGVEA
jgi:hypothetical protein